MDSCRLRLETVTPVRRIGPLIYKRNNLVLRLQQGDSDGHGDIRPQQVIIGPSLRKLIATNRENKQIGSKNKQFFL